MIKDYILMQTYVYKRICSVTNMYMSGGVYLRIFNFVLKK